MDDSYGAGVSSSGVFNYVYPECGSSTVYLYLILIKILRKAL